VHLLSDVQSGLYQEKVEIFEDINELEYRFKVCQGQFGISNSWNLIKNLNVTLMKMVFLKINSDLYNFKGVAFKDVPLPVVLRQIAN
jgi:hypothetical protein